MWASINNNCVFLFSRSESPSQVFVFLVNVLCSLMQLNVVNGKGFPVLGREVGVCMRQSSSLVLVIKITVLSSCIVLFRLFPLTLIGSHHERP